MSRLRWFQIVMAVLLVYPSILLWRWFIHWVVR